MIVESLKILTSWRFLSATSWHPFSKAKASASLLDLVPRPQLYVTSDFPPGEISTPPAPAALRLPFDAPSKYKSQVVPACL